MNEHEVARGIRVVVNGEIPGVHSGRMIGIVDGIRYRVTDPGRRVVIGWFTAADLSPAPEKQEPLSDRESEALRRLQAEPPTQP
jgi:hypothetical protein